MKIEIKISICWHEPCTIFNLFLDHHGQIISLKNLCCYYYYYNLEKLLENHEN
jgi:hypothetical protein